MIKGKMEQFCFLLFFLHNFFLILKIILTVFLDFNSLINSSLRSYGKKSIIFYTIHTNCFSPSAGLKCNILLWAWISKRHSQPFRFTSVFIMDLFNKSCLHNCWNGPVILLSALWMLTVNVHASHHLYFRKTKPFLLQEKNPLFFLHSLPFLCSAYHKQKH